MHGWDNASSCGWILISIKTVLINYYNYPRVHEDKIHLGEGENDL